MPGVFTRRAVRRKRLDESSSVAHLSLPTDCLELIGSHLFGEVDKLHHITHCARDLANLAASCKALYHLSKDLWPKLGKLVFACEACAAGDSGGGGCTSGIMRYDSLHLASDTRLHSLREERCSWRAQFWQMHKAIPQCAPRCVCVEVLRLSSLGIAGSAAKREYVLTDADLRQLQATERDRGGGLGHMWLFRLNDVVAAARAKHGDVAGMEAAKAARAAQGEKMKRARASAAQRRDAALRAALAAERIPFTLFTQRLTPVSLHINGGKPGQRAPGLAATLSLVRLVNWLLQHTEYPQMRSTALQSERRLQLIYDRARTKALGKHGQELEPGFIIGTSLTFLEQRDWREQAAAAAAQLTIEEEEDVACLAAQAWAKARGGDEVALAHAAVPQAGPLRDELEAALGEEMSTNAADWVHDQRAFWCDNCDMLHALGEGEWGSQSELDTDEDLASAGGSDAGEPSGGWGADSADFDDDSSFAGGSYMGGGSGAWLADSVPLEGGSGSAGGSGAGEPSGGWGADSAAALEDDSGFAGGSYMGSGSGAWLADSVPLEGGLGFAGGGDAGEPSGSWGGDSGAFEGDSSSAGGSREGVDLDEPAYEDSAASGA